MKRWLNTSRQETNVIEVVAESNSDWSGLFVNNRHTNTAPTLTVETNGKLLMN